MIEFLAPSDELYVKTGGKEYKMPFKAIVTVGNETNEFIFDVYNNMYTFKTMIVLIEILC